MSGPTKEIRDTYVTWVDSGLEEATTESGEEASAANGSLVNLEKWSGGDKPALVYWTWSDENDKRGKETKKADRNVWDNEKVARVSRLYDCFRVDAKGIPADQLQKLGVKDVPFVQIVNKDQSPIAAIAPTSPGSMETFLQTGVKKFPEYWRTVLQRMQELDRRFNDGKAAMKKKDYDEAISAFNEVYNDNVRTDLISKARELLMQARQKAEKEAAKK